MNERPDTDQTADLRELESRLGLDFDDPALLSRALTHRSYINEHPNAPREDNERLEYLGDAVIDFLVAEYLFRQFPRKDEGELTSLRAALVRSETLAQFARSLDIGPYLLLGQGESDNGGRERAPILCAAFEAVVGAIYLDQGLEAAATLVTHLIGPALKQIQASSLHKDAKSEFQVWAQARTNITPHYRMVASEGPDHAKTFTVQVLVGDDVWGEGRGRSKQAAAQAAAAEALIKSEAESRAGMDDN